jgi:CRISPR-associated endoribonuclease Cas6
MTDIARITLHLRPHHPDTIPAFTGRASQAWYLDALRAIDPALSAAIHDGTGQLKAFTTSGILPLPPGAMLKLSPTQSYRLIVSSLHPDLTRLTLKALLPTWNVVTLHEQPFTVEQSEVETTTYADILTTSLPADQRRLTIDFVTPTVFKRTGDLHMPLPLPEYVFGSLIDRWGRLASATPLHPDMREWIQSHIDIGYHRIGSERVSFERAGKGFMIGFTGAVGYRIHSGEQPFLSQIHGLAQYARFAGTGAKTTIGLGQVEVSA